jgi:hypothetical protein
MKRKHNIEILVGAFCIDICVIISDYNVMLFLLLI